MIDAPVISMLQQVLDALQVRSTLIIGQTPAGISAAPSIAFVGDTSGSYFSGTIVDYALVYFNTSTYESSEILTSAEVNFFDQGDGVVDLTFSARSASLDFRVWLVRYDSNNVGSWQLVTDVTGLTSYRDDNSNWYDYWPSANLRAKTLTSSNLVMSVNGQSPSAQTGDVTLNAGNVGAYTSGQTDSLLASKASASHVHSGSDITSGTVANSRTTGTASATASTIVLRDSNADTAVRVLTAGAISGTIYSSSANGIVLNRNSSSSTGDFAKFCDQTGSTGLFRVTRDGNVICGDITGGVHAGSKFSGSNHTLTQGSTEEVTFVPGGGNMNLTFASGRNFQLFMGATLVVSISGGGTISLNGLTIDTSQRVNAQKLSLHQGFTDEMDWTLNGGNMPLTIYNSRNFTISNGGATKVTIGGSTLGFWGSAVAKGTVTGSRGGNAALASLLTYLASRGDLTDSTTA